MRALVVVAAVVLAAFAAAAAAPQKIVFTRVFPSAGQIGLFIADADGTAAAGLSAAAAIDQSALLERGDVGWPRIDARASPSPAPI